MVFKFHDPIIFFFFYNIINLLWEIMKSFYYTHKISVYNKQFHYIINKEIVILYICEISLRFFDNHFIFVS